jgi:hypothetical protein
LVEGDWNILSYSPKDYEFFSRYNALDAILKGVESVLDENYETVDKCKEVLKAIGESSQTIFTERVASETEQRAMEDERNKFATFIENITEDDLKTVLPLPYNRKLREDESARIGEKLKELWNYDGGYWDPLEEKCKRETIFVMDKFLTKGDKARIIEFISEAGGRYFKIDNDHSANENYDNYYETEIPEITGYETVITDMNLKWIIYISYEATITFGGAALIAFVKILFRERTENLNKWEY